MVWWLFFQRLIILQKILYQKIALILYEGDMYFSKLELL